MATVAELLQQYGVTDPSQIGFRYVDIQDPTAGDNAGIATGAEYFNKATGAVIPDMLGNNQFLVVDKDTGQVKVQQGWNDSFFGGFAGRLGDIVSNPGVQYIGTAALLGNLAAGNLGTLGGAAAAPSTAEAAMADLMATEAAGAGAGALSGLSASQIANLAKAGVSVAGLLGGGAALSNIGGGSGVSSIGGLPTQGTPMNTPEYYQSLQNYYSSYFPSAPKDVVTPLQQWYSGTFQPSASIPSSPVTIPSNIAAQTSPTSVQALISAINSLKPTTTASGTTTAPSVDTAAKKANLYNQLLDTGLSDSQVKQVIEANLGPQTPTDWQYLQDLANVQTVAQDTGLLTGTMADKVEAYNQFIDKGLSDTDIKNIIETVAGPQTPTDWNYLQQAAKVQSVSTSKDPLVKAQEYNALLSSGMTDAQVRSLVEAAVGPQTDTDWKYLQQLASR